MRKGEIACSNFSFSHYVFYGMWHLKCRLQSFNSDQSEILLSGNGLTLPHYTILALYRLKAFADDNFIVAGMVQFLFDWVKNIVGKCWLPVFSSFSHNVFKYLFHMIIKKSSLLGKGFSRKHCAYQHFLLFPQCFQG